MRRWRSLRISRVRELDALRERRDRSGQVGVDETLGRPLEEAGFERLFEGLQATAHGRMIDLQNSRAALDRPRLTDREKEAQVVRVHDVRSRGVRGTIAHPQCKLTVSRRASTTVILLTCPTGFGRKWRKIMKSLLVTAPIVPGSSMPGDASSPPSSESDGRPTRPPSARGGLTRLRVWHHRGPAGVDTAVVQYDGPAPERFLERIMTSTDDFAKWFRTQGAECHGFGPSSPPPPPPELVVERQCVSGAGESGPGASHADSCWSGAKTARASQAVRVAIRTCT